MEKKISKKTLSKSFHHWYYGNLTCFSQEHMQTFGYLTSMLPIIEELYDKKEDQAKALKTYTAFFNTEPQLGTVIVGVPGAIAATIGCILPSCILVTIIAYFYLKYRHLRFLQNILNYLRPAVVALIATAGVTIMISALFGSEAAIILNNFRIHQFIIFLFCVFMLWCKKANPIFVIILSGIINVIYHIII